MKPLYHGTTFLFDTIDPNMGSGYKDFGKGFYATASVQHAERMALRNKRILAEKQNRSDEKTPIFAYVYDLEFDDSVLPTLKHKVFREGEDDLEWVRFVNANRSCPTKTHDNDIVIGATADDATDIVFNVFRSGGYGDPNSTAAQEMLLRLLETWKLPRQYWFSVDGAKLALRIVKRRSVR